MTASRWSPWNWSTWLGVGVGLADHGLLRAWCVVRGAWCVGVGWGGGVAGAGGGGNCRP